MSKDSFSHTGKPQSLSHPSSRHIFVSAGDLSAEDHAVRLIKCLREEDPHIFISSVGGGRIREVSDLFIGDTISLETFGFTPSLRSVYGLWKIYKKVLAHIAGESSKLNIPPVLCVVLVDFFGFNSRIAASAKNIGLKVFYYIPPQVWATRYGRIKKIKSYVDRVFLTLPFEEEIYRREGIDYEYVGHPLVEKIPSISNNDKKTPSQPPIVGFFPGSRGGIIKRHIPILNAVATYLKDKIPEVKIKLFGLSSVKSIYYEGLSRENIQIVFDAKEDERRQIDCALSVSGTIATELALMKIPSVIFYKVSAANAFILKKMLKVKYVALPNIILGREVFPEYLQEGALDVKRLSESIVSFIKDENLRSKTIRELVNFRRKLEPPTENPAEKYPVSRKVARLILETLRIGNGS